ncbi:cold shock protein 2-like [Mangifera indica]|uniref:cold shock protein 2-like n=1 Tax=Mangifera indica TaxID=29780 RepID=UPI001CF9F2D5|nr:cold shock protein 2-like [Mangifera indica]
MNSKTSFLLAILLITSLCMSTRPGSSYQFSAQTKPTTSVNNNNNRGGGLGGILGPGSGFRIPGFRPGIIGGGYGGGYGGPNGGHSKNGVIRPSMVCKEKGPCYMKKLTCPSKCFTSYSRSGKGYGGGGGGGGCTMDCKKKCIAYC